MKIFFKFMMLPEIDIFHTINLTIRLSGTAPSHFSQINPRNFCYSLIALSFYHDLFEHLRSDTIYTKVETCVSK